MKIINIQSNINFGKTAVATCNITEKNTGKKIPATIFQMDPLNERDYREIRYSKNTSCLNYGLNLERENAPYGKYREFYIVKNDKTGEVISCAQTQHRFRSGEMKYTGLSTMLEETSENTKYRNGALPLIAYIAQRANDRYDNSIISVLGTDESRDIVNELKFKQTNTEGVFALSKRRFANFINRAKKENQLEILV